MPAGHENQPGDIGCFRAYPDAVFHDEGGSRSLPIPRDSDPPAYPASPRHTVRLDKNKYELADGRGNLAIDPRVSGIRSSNFPIAALVRSVERAFGHLLDRLKVRNDQP